MKQERYLYLILAIALIALLFNLNSYGVLEASEARYAEISREMFRSGNLLQPTLLNIFHFHKPPVTFWLTGVGFQLFGVNAFGARFWLQLSLILQGILIYLISQRLFGKKDRSVLAVVIYLSFPLSIVSARNLTTDNFLTISVLAVIYGMTVYYCQGQIWGIYVAALFMGVGFLTKAPAIFIVPFFYWCYLMFARRVKYRVPIKHLSIIEIATLGFSLGQGFAGIPLDRIVDISTLLSPLKFDPALDYSDVFNRLMRESTHPPLYFWLTHWWLKLFADDGQLVSLTLGRSLSAIFGGLAIPAIFGLSWVAFRSRLIAHLAAALMAVSPYGIYLAQEARHYTLTILWIIASLTCLATAAQYIERRTRLPIGLGCFWIVINALGMATHYFFALALAAEALVVVGLCFWDFKRDLARFSFNYWWRITAVGMGTLVSCLVWLPVASGISSNELTDWIQTSYELGDIWQPLPRMLAWLITMLMLLPIEGTPTAITVISALFLLSVLIWLVPALIRGWKSALHSKLALPLKVFLGYWLGAILILLLVIYGLGKDVSLAARYHFVYFPTVIVAIAVALATLWQSPRKVS